MAEKEERIVIAKMITGLDDDGSAKLDHFKIYTIKEAINRMAKALIDIALTGHYSRFEDSCIVEDAIPYAKAALNALLEEGEEK